MKVGILTFHWAYNYGAVLQAYALRQTIESMGHDVQFIYNQKKWWQGWGVRRGLLMPKYALQRLRHDRFKKYFFAFRNNYLPQTLPCRTTQELKDVATEFDAIIVGSDQVWNGYTQKKISCNYFLDFVDRSKCKKISYAACFGNPQQPPGFLKAISPCLRDFDFISVRNQMSADLVRKSSGLDAEVVLDPTLLHNYQEFLKNNNDSKAYILAYFLPHEHMNLGHRILQEIKNNLQLPAKAIYTPDVKILRDEIKTTTTPEEWLNLFKNAAFICTNSFHGTVFSIKFGKPFITWSAESSSGTRGPARMLDFLEICGLQHRLVADGDPQIIKKLMGHAPDYEIVAQKLIPHLQRSRAFLQKVLTT